MIIIDNVSFHRDPEVETLCVRAGVKVIFLALYSPDRKPIEEIFTELEAFIKKHWMVFKANPGLNFQTFLE